MGERAFLTREILSATPIATLGLMLRLENAMCRVFSELVRFLNGGMLRLEPPAQSEDRKSKDPRETKGSREVRREW